MRAWRRKLQIHVEQTEERVARLEAEVDHLKAALKAKDESGCKCGKKWNINPERPETIWTFGPNLPADRP
jgi:hypothetical protein